MLFQFSAPAYTKYRAFTLIELLVVIGIIAILAALVFPAGQGAINSARKATAKNQCVQIATAITAYETEYGMLPSSNSTPVNSTLISTLTTNNPRGIVFLDASAWKLGKGGTNSSGAFCDPFADTNQYQVALDTTYANQISVPTNSSGARATITKHVGVWTIPTVGKTNVLINSWD